MEHACGVPFVPSNQDFFNRRVVVELIISRSIFINALSRTKTQSVDRLNKNAQLSTCENKMPNFVGADESFFFHLDDNSTQNQNKSEAIRNCVVAREELKKNYQLFLEAIKAFHRNNFQPLELRLVPRHAAKLIQQPARTFHEIF